jgi:predicted metalloprotease with PDZ domain
VRLLPSSDVGEPDLPCEHSYRGIGIRTSDGALIESVSQGGPADKAGLKAGDRIVNAQILMADRYMVGHRLTLRVSREGREFAVEVVIGRICYE